MGLLYLLLLLGCWLVPGILLASRLTVAATAPERLAVALGLGMAAEVTISFVIVMVTGKALTLGTVIAVSGALTALGVFLPKSDSAVFPTGTSANLPERH